MDEMCVWFEVVRAMLPQRYGVRLAGSNVIIVTAPDEERVAWIDEHELRGIFPNQAVRLIEEKLRMPESHIAARFAAQMSF